MPPKVICKIPHPKVSLTQNQVKLPDLLDERMTPDTLPPHHLESRHHNTLLSGVGRLASFREAPNVAYRAIGAMRMITHRAVSLMFSQIQNSTTVLATGPIFCFGRILCRVTDVTENSEQKIPNLDG